MEGATTPLQWGDCGECQLFVVVAVRAHSVKSHTRRQWPSSVLSNSRASFINDAHAGRAGSKPEEVSDERLCSDASVVRRAASYDSPTREVLWRKIDSMP